MLPVPSGETVFGFVEDLHTRPIVLVNSENDSVYVFAKGGLNPESIYMKAAHLDNPQFESGPGILFIRSEDDSRIGITLKKSPEDLIGRGHSGEAGSLGFIDEEELDLVKRVLLR